MISRSGSAMIVLCAAAMALAQAHDAAAQQLFPESVENFKLTDWGGEFFVDSFYYADNEQRSGTSTEQTEFFSQQGVDLWSKGFIYHPNLVDWTAGLRLGVSYDDIAINNDTGTNFGELLGYNFSALLLKEKPVTGRLFASLNHQLLGRSFTRPVQLDTRSEGFEIVYKSPILVSLLFEHRVSKEDSEFRLDDEDTLLAKLHVTDQRHRDWLTELTYEHEEVDETLQFSDPTLGPLFTQDLSETRDEAVINNRWAFGEGPLQHHLSGGARLLHREGFFNNDLILVNQRLDLAHSDSLSSFYSGSVDLDKTDEQTERTLRAEAGVTKRIYQSLILGARVDALDRDFETGTERSIGIDFDADYTKQTPIGRYSSNLSLGRRYEQERSDTGQRTILDEAVTLSGATPVALNFARVVTGSVTVTDTTNTIPYFQGIDYELQPIGSFTEIRRLVGGSIADGQTVFVDYRVDLSRNADFHTDIFSWSHRIRFDDVPLAMYIEYHLRNEIFDSGVDPMNLEKDERWLLGSEVFIDDFTISAEYEKRNLRLSPPWDAYRGRLNYLRLLTPESSISATAHYEMLEYQQAAEFGLDPGRDFRESYGFNANFTSKIQRNLLVRLEASYEKTSGRNNDELIRIGPSVTWFKGAMELTVSGYQAFYQQEETEGDTTYFSINFKRKF
jgi:opacity protein-like surface antigen